LRSQQGHNSHLQTAMNALFAEPSHINAAKGAEKIGSCQAVGC
jgi:hypothetical protein